MSFLFQAVWQQLERLVVAGDIKHLGVTDFDYESLKELCENTKVSCFFFADLYFDRLSISNPRTMFRTTFCPYDKLEI